MYPPSILLTATARALHGESDPHVIEPALCNHRLACVLALAPNVHPVISALGALTSGLPELLSPTMRDSPAFHATIASLIGTRMGSYVLDLWTKVAPAGWGASHADALRNAVQHNRCAPWVAAAPIGPTDETAALLHRPQEIADAIRRWGQATPDHPTAWMDTLEPAQRDRLMETLRAEPPIAVTCLPWLPKANANNVVAHIERTYLPLALDAYAAASSIARTRHADVLSTLMQHSEPSDLAALTRLAVASGMDAAWAAVVRLLRANPWSAVHIVAAAPWDDIPENVQTIILSAADHNDGCAAIAFARGDRTVPPTITQATARAFFAAVTPEVWTALPAETQHAWRSEIIFSDIAVLAVRSLEPDPAFLAGAALNDDLIAAVRRHIRDDGDLRHTLLPVAVRDLPIADIPAVVAALPLPDPVAFVQIAGCRRDLPPALRDWITAHPTPRSCSTAMTLLHIAEQRGFPIDRCAALAAALADWSREETDALLAALPDDAHAALRFDSNALARALAHPDRRDAFRQALDALDNLPSSVAIPARHALGALAQTAWQLGRRYAGEILATVLRSHGRIFADIVGALADAVRSAVLPRRDHPHDEAALDDLAAADPLVAHYLSHALHANDSIAAYNALTAASLEETRRIWQSLPNALQQSVLGDRDALLREVAAPGHTDALAQRLQAWEADDPLSLLALRMLIDNDEARRARGAALLARRPNMAASLLPLLRDDLRVWLETDPRIAVACADIPPPHPSKPVRRQRSQAR